MGYAIAEAALAAGYDVTLISGPVNLDPPPSVQFVSILTSDEMYSAVHRHAREWVEDLSALAARTGMHEFGVRACLMRSELGDRRSLDSAAALVAEVENPALRERVQGLRATVAV